MYLRLWSQKPALLALSGPEGKGPAAPKRKVAPAKAKAKAESQKAQPGERAKAQSGSGGPGVVKKPGFSLRFIPPSPSDLEERSLLGSRKTARGARLCQQNVCARRHQHRCAPHVIVVHFAAQSMFGVVQCSAQGPEVDVSTSSSVYGTFGRFKECISLKDTLRCLQVR